MQDAQTIQITQFYRRLCDENFFSKYLGKKIELDRKILVWVLALVIADSPVPKIFQKRYTGGHGSPPNLSKMLCDEKEPFEKSPIILCTV